MRKVINGKKYDTDTAKQICIDANCFNGGNISSWDVMYKKKTGEFFIHHEPSGQNCFDTVEYIKPLSVDEAKEFGEKCMESPEYESAFGHVSE